MSANGPAALAERRNDVNAALMHLIEELTKQVHEMREENKRSQAACELERVQREKDRDNIIARLLAESFPAGDHEAHRKYHERLIKADEEKIAFWKKMREELTKWGLIGFCGWFIVFAGHAFWLEVLHQLARKP